MFAQEFITNPTLAIGIFFTFAILVGGLATLVTKLAVAVKDKANLPDGVVGGILIGAITSIPEFITAIGLIVSAAGYSIADHADGYNPGAVFGDVIGSNMFCLLIIAVACIATVWIFRHREADQINTITIICLIVGSVLCLLAVLFENNGLIYGDNTEAGPSPLVWHGFNLFSLFIFFSYVLAIVFMVVGSKIVRPAAVVGKGVATTTKLPQEQMKKESRFLKLNMSALIILLVVGVGVLTYSSVILASSCNGCITHWFDDDSVTFGRTLLLGIATSLPELIAVITLAFNGRYNMMINSMVGSCAFNMTILFVCNCVYAALWQPGQAPMFPMPADQNSVMVQVVLFILMCVFFALYLIINSKSIKGNLKRNQILGANITLLSLTILSYFGYIALGIIQGISV